MPTVLNTLLGRTAKKGKKGKKKTQKKGVAKASATPNVSVSANKSSNNKAKNSANMKNDGVDVKAAGDVGKLVDLIKKNKIVVVLVYADWCGHCKTFKEDVWKKLSALPNRKVPMAEVNEQAFAATPLAASGAKVDGYPTVLMMGNDMKPAVFKDENGEETTAMPNTRDLEMMKTIVTTDPDAALAGVSGSEEESEPEPTSVQPTAEAEENLNNAGDEALANLNMGASAMPSAAPTGAYSMPPNPPDAEDDLLSAQGTGTLPTPLMPSGLPLNSAGLTTTGAALAEAQDGGSLYYAMLEAAKGVAPAAALAGAAVYLDRRSKSSKRARRAARRRATAKKLRNAAATGAV